MDVGKTASSASTEEVRLNSGEKLPEEINLEKRKEIIRKELDKLLGENLETKIKRSLSVAKNLNAKDAEKKKTRRKIAQASKKKNWGR